jgi:hypothetical protein
VKKIKQPDDVKYSIKYLRYLRDQPLQVFDVPHDKVTSFLVEVLAVQVELKSDNFKEDIEEMAILCDKLLNSDILASPPPGPFMALAKVINAKQVLTGQVGDQAIECLREASIRLPHPHVHILSLELARSLTSRFSINLSNDDYEEAATILDRTIASTSHLPEEHRGPLQVEALHQAAMLPNIRSAKLGKPEYLEEAISRIRTYLSLVSLDDPFRPHLSRRLAQLMDMRVREFGVGEAGCSSHTMSI